MYSIQGEPPDLVGEIEGCAFAERCTYAVERCFNDVPALEQVDINHLVSCWEKDKVRKSH